MGRAKRAPPIQGDSEAEWVVGAEPTLTGIAQTPDRRCSTSVSRRALVYYGPGASGRVEEEFDRRPTAPRPSALAQARLDNGQRGTDKAALKH
eukprot:CAMPEP_0174384416 /NCGR_PEP_ID=MMETSP0811_2-20130205/125904_1 /TAXON_ID=73025 ORGANISM="Eutreptiella gymnastica-like, Strain CCMP1594" /NCGR_SAMPLE_ID=MMETSP0811_2 /ASSEMBLY_ACC=CAM_ASM_000667 /LENGTH=92 /DNA_ID=CAMNT_0015538365 /DNA_START=1083 /DNA_END=1359 /DNA_ORIENTATION=-